MPGTPRSGRWSSTSATPIRRTTPRAGRGTCESGPRSIPSRRACRVAHDPAVHASAATIYMDGRPHPSENAPHTWQGFSTGEWEGDMLKVTTTHLKEGWIRRNGLPRSEHGYIDRIFHPARGILHTGYRCRGSRLSDGAVRPNLKLDTGPGAPVPAQFLHSQRRGSASEGLRGVPLARGESVAD